jgi:hypothetical protein
MELQAAVMAAQGFLQHLRVNLYHTQEVAEVRLTRLPVLVGQVEVVEAGMVVLLHLL